ncbi:MAG: hypothetical protein ABJO97_15610 [Roseibium sp.]|uniref:hypothetical protein n=2 Tax=Pseudomonadota TaxID=1224 RepID=UPI0032976BDA
MDPEMPEVTGYGSAQVFSPRAGDAGPERTAEKLQQINVQQERVVAETVQRQADLSSNRAETLARQAEQIEGRVQAREAQEGLGNRLDVTV